jgi:hypothetical protein
LLKHPDFSKEFILETGATLKQQDEIIGLFSKKFSKTELNYSIVEKEALGIIKALEHFKPIIFNSNILIRTDHKKPYI